MLRSTDRYFVTAAWPLKMGPIGCPKTSVTDYLSTGHIIPEERSSHLHRGRSLKSSVLFLAIKFSQKKNSTRNHSHGSADPCLHSILNPLIKSLKNCSCYLIINKTLDSFHFAPFCYLSTLGLPPQRGQYPTVQTNTLENPQHYYKSAFTNSKRYLVLQTSRRGGGGGLANR
jgi:hypothetical protein